MKFKDKKNIELSAFESHFKYIDKAGLSSQSDRCLKCNLQLEHEFKIQVD